MPFPALHSRPSFFTGRHAGFFGLRRKFLLAFTALVLALTIGLLLVVENRQRSAIVREMKKRGLTIATHLAAVSTNALLTYNFVALAQNVKQVSQGQDVLYTIILDRDGQVAAHSQHDDQVGTRLPGIVDQRAAQTTVPLVQRVRSTTGQTAHYDIAVPVFIPQSQGGSAQWGAVRVGLSLRDMQAEILQTRLQVLLLGVFGVLLSTAVAAFLARRIAAPIHALVEGTVAVARGDLAHTIPVNTRDEIAVLATNFNHMTGELRKHQSALEATNHQLDHKVQELSILSNYNENILGSMTSGLLTLDPEGCIATLNPAAETITGLQATAVCGQPYQEVFVNNVACLQILDASWQHRTPLAAPRLEFTRDDGGLVPLALRTAPLHDRAGHGEGLLAIFEDLSPIQTLEQQLHRADRLASLGQMTAGVAHEIKNPLTSIRVFVQRVAQKHDDPRFLERFDRVVPLELDRINGIVEELLELARPARLHCVPVALPEILQRVVDVYAERVQQQHILIKTDFAAALPLVLADAEHLQRCFTNIVLNAIEAMPMHGELVISCRPVPKALVDFAAPGSREAFADPHRAASLTLDLYATNIEIVFRDTGAGIPPEQLDAVFTPFWTTKPKGTGLGLALTHKIIEEHRGSMHIASEMGQGTAVTLVLPPAMPAPPSSA